MIWTSMHFLVAIVCSQPYMCRGARILMMPIQMKSHVSCFVSVAKVLVEKGHQIDIVVLETLGVPKDAESPNLRFLSFESSLNAKEVNDKLAEVNIAEHGNMDPLLEILKTLTDTGCRDILVNNEDFIASLESSNYDLAMMDALFIVKCFYLIPHRLGIPVISLVDVFEPWLARLPWLPSVVPNAMLSYSDDMRFHERLTNAAATVAFSLFVPVPPPPPDILKRYEKYGHFDSLDDLVSKTQLWLHTSDAVLDYSVPLLPNVIPVGGLTTAPAKPLQPQLDKLIASSPNGFILVSFGSSADMLPKPMTDMFLRVLGSIDAQVIWRLKKQDGMLVPSNIHLMDWLPQNDLLGDRRIRLFVTHCGKNGLYEAVYHGVPLVGTPMWGDQWHNAQAVQTKGYGETVDVFTATDEQLHAAVDKVLRDTSYKQKMQRASDIFHHQIDSPAERAAHWVEHILQFGGDHLRSHAFELRWYEYFMLDLLAFILTVLGVVLAVVWNVLKCCCRLFRKRSSKVKTS